MFSFQYAAFGNTSDNQVIKLTLEEAINLALRTNRNLLNSASGVESQRLSLSSAESEFDLKIFPSASAGLSDDTETVGTGISLGKKFRTGIKTLLSPQVQKADEYSCEISISLEIPLLRDFGKEKNLDKIRRSQFSLRTAKRSFYQTQVNTVLDTVSAVYDIIKQKELVRLYESQVRDLKGHAKTAKVREKVGLATPLDIYRAEIRLKDVEDSLTLARENLRNAKDRLNLILAISMEKTTDVSAPMEFEKINTSLKEATEIALKNRVELEHAEDEVREARRKSDIAKHDILPRLNLEMNYERYAYSEDIDKSMRLDEDRWSINLVSNTDFARTSEKANYQQSLIHFRTSRLNLEAKQDEIKRDVRRQTEALRKSEERIKIRKEQIKQAEGKLALAKVKFNHGMADNFDIIEAETELRKARVNLLSVETDYIVGIYRMRAVLGTLIER